MAKYRNKRELIEAIMFPGVKASIGSTDDHPDLAPFRDWLGEHLDEATFDSLKDTVSIEDVGTAIAGDWIVGLEGGKLDIIDAGMFQLRFEPLPGPLEFEDDELTLDAAGTELTPLTSPLQIGDIDAVSFAAVTAHAAAGQLFGLLTTEEGGLISDWMGSRRGDIEADVNAFAGFLHAQKLDNAETLWLQATGEGWIGREAPRWADVPFARRQAFTVFASVASKVLASIGSVQQQLIAEQQAARAALQAPALDREDSIDPAPERMDALIEGFEKKPAKAGGFKNPAAFDHDGDGKPGGSKPRTRKLSIGDTLVKPPVNRGGRGRTRVVQDSARK